jgi:hypothetical protein
MQMTFKDKPVTLTAGKAQDREKAESAKRLWRINGIVEMISKLIW